MPRMSSFVAAVALMLALASPALAQTFNSGSTGVDGAFSPSCAPTPCTVNVALPPSGVFNFTTINVAAGITVKFTPNADNTPVTALASGNVTIAGTIDVSGGTGGGSLTGTNLSPNGGAPGPAGYAGGSGTNVLISTTGGAGLGPGGGGGGTNNTNAGGGGGFGTAGARGTCCGGTAGTGGPTYGAPTLLPLIGGSGGGGGGANFGFTGGGGGGGGGALLIASTGTIALTGALLAKGGAGGGSTCVSSQQTGGGGGSGGGVRLLATAMTGTGGTISVAGGTGGGGCASGGAGGAGRIRIEASSNTATLNYSSPPSLDQPGLVALGNTPSLRIASVAGAAAPTSPTGSYTAPDLTLPASTANPVAVVLAAANIPPGTVVTVLSNGLQGGRTSATATLAGTSSASSATASLTIPTNEPTVITASCTFTLAALDEAPFYAEGEPVEQVRVTAAPDSPTEVIYITRSGREILASAR